MKKQKGAVTVVLSIMLASVIFFTFILCDATEISVTVFNEEYKTELALSSVLACYDTDIHGNYLLYGVDFDESEKLNNLFYDCLTGNSEKIFLSEEAVFRDISGFKVRSREVTSSEPLSDLSVLETQICDVMKYRVPAEIFSDVLDYIADMGEAGKASKAYKMYKNAAQTAAEGERVYDELYTLIYGSFEGDTECVNGYPKSTAKLFADNLITFSGFEGHYFEDSLNMAYVFFQSYLEINGEAYRKVLELENIAESAKKQIVEIESSLSSGKNEQSIGFSTVIAELNGILQSVGTLKIKEKLSANLTSLSALQNDMDSMRNELTLRITENRDIDSDVRDALKESLKNLSVDNNIHMEKNIKDVPGSQINIADNSKYLLQILNSKTELKVLEEDIYKTLPSVVQGKNSCNILLYDFSSLFTNGELNFDEEFFTRELEKAGNNIYKAVMLDEYILSVFSDTKNQDVSRYGYFQSETEYIISGTRDENQNRTYTEEKIISIRFIFNLMHIISDKDKFDYASEAGQSMANAISEGAGGPLYAAGIMCMWALCEGAIDMDRLLQGEKVPLVKTKKDWHLDLENCIDSKSKEADKNQPGLDYKGYLRIVLLFEDYETKLYRIMDLIEINETKTRNSRFSISSLKTSVKCVVTFQIDLFVYKDRKYEFTVTSQRKY